MPIGYQAGRGVGVGIVGARWDIHPGRGRRRCGPGASDHVRTDDRRPQGARACLTVYADAARGAADAADARARAGLSLGPLDGTVVSIKDLFDVAGEPTRAGSKVLADAPAASNDAPVVRRLRAAGSVIIAKTNMTEFAF